MPRSAARTAGKRAVAVCGREAFCATCQAQRAARVLEKRRGTIAGASGDVGAVATGTESGGTLRGHAIVFGARSLDLGGFVEIIRPSAVDRTIAEKTDLRALWNHNSESNDRPREGGNVEGREGLDRAARHDRHADMGAWSRRERLERRE